MSLEKVMWRCWQRDSKMLCCWLWRWMKRPWTKEYKKSALEARKNKETHPPVLPPEGVWPCDMLISALWSWFLTSRTLRKYMCVVLDNLICGDLQQHYETYAKGKIIITWYYNVMLRVFSNRPIYPGLENYNLAQLVRVLSFYNSVKLVRSNGMSFCPLKENNTGRRGRMHRQNTEGF